MELLDLDSKELAILRTCVESSINKKKEYRDTFNSIYVNSNRKNQMAKTDYEGIKEEIKKEEVILSKVILRMMVGERKWQK